MVDRIIGCRYRHKASIKKFGCSNPLRADGEKWIECPYDGWVNPSVCALWDDGKDSDEVD